MKPNSYQLVDIDVDAPPTEPVTLTEAKAQLRVDHDDDDDYISALITAAREFCEEHTNRAFVLQSWVLGYAGWPCSSIWDRVVFKPELVLARPPVFEVVSVKYYPVSSDTLADLDADLYKFDADALPGVIRLTRKGGLPSLNLDYSSPIRVEISCGYESAALVPARARLAIKQMVTQFYENRVPVVTGTISSEIPLTALALLSRLKIRKF